MEDIMLAQAINEANQAEWRLKIAATSDQSLKDVYRNVLKSLEREHDLQDKRFEEALKKRRQEKTTAESKKDISNNEYDKILHSNPNDSLGPDSKSKDDHKEKNTKESSSDDNQLDYKKNNNIETHPKKIEKQIEIL